MTQKTRTHRGAAKRFRRTATGRIRRRRANHSHILTKKSPKRRRRLRGGAFVSPAEARQIGRMIAG